MINFIISILIMYYIVLPLIFYAWYSFTNMFKKQEKYVEPVKPYTIEDWLCSKH